MCYGHLEPFYIRDSMQLAPMDALWRSNCALRVKVQGLFKSPVSVIVFSDHYKFAPGLCLAYHSLTVCLTCIYSIRTAPLGRTRQKRALHSLVQ